MTVNSRYASIMRVPANLSSSSRQKKKAGPVEKRSHLKRDFNLNHETQGMEALSHLLSILKPLEAIKGLESQPQLYTAS